MDYILIHVKQQDMKQRTLQWQTTILQVPLSAAWRIAEAPGLKHSTCCNLTRTPAAGNFLEKSRERYHLGRAAGELGAKYSRPLFPAEMEAELFRLRRFLPEGTVIFARMTPNGIAQTHRISTDYPVIQHIDEPLLNVCTSTGGLRR